MRVDMWEYCTRVKGFGVPSDDAASPPHQGDGAVVEGPAELFGGLSQQHEPLRVGDDLGSVKSLRTQTHAAFHITSYLPRDS